jgi:hypothetical protein
MARGTYDRENRDDRDDRENRRQYEMPPARDGELIADKIYAIEGTGKLKYMPKGKIYHEPGSMAMHLIKMGAARLVNE